MTRTGAPPPAMVQAPVMQDNFLLQEVNLRLGEHLKCGQQWGLSKGGSLVEGGSGARGAQLLTGHLFRAPRWEPPGELSPLPHHPQPPHTWAKQKRQASVFGGLSVGARLKGWAGPQGGWERPAVCQELGGEGETSGHSPGDQESQK